MAAVIDKEKIGVFIDFLAREYNVVAPAEEDGMFFFRPYTPGGEVSLTCTNTVVSPKEFLFPQTEKMLSFSANGEKLSISDSACEPGQQLIFGVRACDMAGIAALDPVFSEPFCDPYYSTKRKNTLFVGLSCTAAGSTCFCRSFGIDPVKVKGADITLLDAGDYLTIQAYTDKGHLLLDQCRNYLHDLPDSAVETQAARLAAALEASFGDTPDLGGVKEFLDHNFEAPIWNEISPACIGCGICTFTCPTCHCFDIFDFSRGKPGGARYRCWDSCMFTVFTKMAGGHNPRPTPKERLRNRLMHKLKYHLDRYDINGCVGCGRCVEKCPVNIDIRRFIMDVKEAAAHV